jgi:hypothetical protein
MKSQRERARQNLLVATVNVALERWLITPANLSSYYMKTSM